MSNHAVLSSPMVDKLSKILMLLEILHMQEVEKQYEECVEGGGDPYMCWMGLGGPWWIIPPPRPPRPDVLKAASYDRVLKDMRVLALETVEIIDGFLEKGLP